MRKLAPRGSSVDGRSATPRRPVLVSVGGGKGGVGKSVVAGNVAIALAQLGLRTVIVDLDFGAANQHTLFGMDRPGRTLQALLDKEVASLEEAVVPTGLPRLSLVPGIGAVPGAANLAHAQKLKVLRHVANLDADFVVIDVGAGVSFNVIDCFAAGELRLVVTTPQLPSLQNAHCFLKAAVHRAVRQRVEAHPAGGREVFEQCWGRSETERLGGLRDRLRELDPALEAEVVKVTSGFGTRLVGNMLETDGQERVIGALRRMARDFLDLDVPVGAALRLTPQMHASVTHRTPLLLSTPNDPNAHRLRALAESLATEDIERIRALRAGSTTESSPSSARPEMPSGVEESLGAPLVAYLRQEERVEVDLPVELVVRGRKVACRALDVSRRGVRVTGVSQVELHEQVALTFLGVPELPTLRGVVRHVPVSSPQLGIELLPESGAAIERALDALRARGESRDPRREPNGGVSWTSQP